jgi:type I restriction enzyme M protein
VGPTTDEAEPPVETNDSLAADPGGRFKVVMTNPPSARSRA